MSIANDSGDRSAALRAGTWCLQNRHFLIAATFLAMAAIGWNIAVQALDLAIQKRPVPWPAAVTVDAKTFRNTSLPKQLGPFERVEADGALDRNPNGTPKQDGIPDGETIFKADLLGPLEIGTWMDEHRVAQRRSNWYVSRIYKDTRNDPAGTRYWRVSLYYYTGVRDQVPHVGEVCLAAAGASILSTDDARFEVNGPREAWQGEVPFQRTVFLLQERSGETQRKYVQYHAFSINDRVTTNRFAVRTTLALPWVDHAYFAKIEFAPLWPVTDAAEADEAAREFAAHFVPEAIRALPSAEEVRALDEADRPEP